MKSINQFTKKLEIFKKPNESIIKEISLIIGFISLLRGLWMLHPAAMWIIGGSILLWVGFPAKGVK